MDCYVKAKFGDRVITTLYDNNGGMEPLWN